MDDKNGCAQSILSKQIVTYKQCDQIEQFLKLLGGKFSYKSSPNIWWLLGLFWNLCFFKKKLLLLLFGQLWEKFGLLFIFTSSHTAYKGSWAQDQEWWRWRWCCSLPAVLKPLDSSLLLTKTMDLTFHWKTF